MEDKQKIEELVTLSSIGSLKQLLTSYLVAECIIEIRGERKEEIKKIAKDSLPKLNVNDERYQKVYEKFASTVNYSPTFIFLAKIGLEDMKKYQFNEDPSVVQNANQDSQHLQQAFGSTYSSLSMIDLESHTLNVFENGVDSGSKKGRIMQTAIPMLACLFHDFGKSTQIRNELIGESIGRAYRAHAEVSEMYVREVLATKYHNRFTEHSTETVELLANVVKNHHPANNRMKSDSMISFVIAADINARKQEIKEIKQKMK
jgi:hypothetical protein